MNQTSREHRNNEGGRKDQSGTLHLTSMPLLHAGLATANSRFGIANTGQTTALPSTLGTITANEFAWWIVLS
jgi:hypothetical protein